MDYTIQEANNQQRDYISNRFWSRTPKWQENRYNYFFYIASDIEANIIGYIVLEEKDIPVSPHGKDWFIVTIMVLESYRRNGIGTALLTHAFKVAQEAEIRNFQGSANPTIQAHMFWLKNKFCFLQYGKQHNDINREKEYGNYSHMIFRRVDDLDVCIKNNNEIDQFKVDVANQEQLDDIFLEYIEPQCANIYKINKNKIKGIIASNEQGEIVGFITWLEMELMPPLHGIQWCIPYLHVDSEYNSNGIDRVLILKLLQLARDNKVQQLLAVYHNEDVLKYWYDLGFDVFLYRHLFKSKTGRNSIAIGKNINLNYK